MPTGSWSDFFTGLTKAVLDLLAGGGYWLVGGLAAALVTWKALDAWGKRGKA